MSLSLETRKKLAAPIYKLGWWLIRLADKVDGPQPKRKK